MWQVAKSYKADPNEKINSLLAKWFLSAHDKNQLSTEKLIIREVITINNPADWYRRLRNDIRDWVKRGGSGHSTIARINYELQLIYDHYQQNASQVAQATVLSDPAPSMENSNIPPISADLTGLGSIAAQTATVKRKKKQNAEQLSLF